MDITWTTSLHFYINGAPHTVHNADPRMTLLEYLRSAKVGLYGTKLSCGEGGCGACTVMVSSYDQATQKIRHKSVNACLAPLCSVDGEAVTTVEGVGSVRGGLDVVQEKIAASHGSQCGFCTPGIVMSVYTARRNGQLGELGGSLDGNLCRCTGYRPIIEGVKQIASICPSSGKPCDCNKAQCGQPVEPSAEFIFPPSLMLRPVVAPLRISDGNATWWRPATLDQLLHIKALHNHARIVAGNTEVGIEAKFKGMHFRDLVSPGLISELHVFESSGEGVTIGASVTLTDLATHLKRLKEVLPEWKCRGIGAILYQLQWFAGSQIRNVASIGGNIATASPISDLNPIWIALGSTLELASLKNGRRTISMSDFFLAYRKTALHPDEVIIALKFPLPQKKGEFVRAFKQARRKEDDIAIVSACFRILISEDAGLVSDACLVFGGMAARTIRAERTEKSLIGKRFLEDATFEAALIELQQDVPLPINAVGGMAAFRCTLTASFFFKFFQFVMSEIDPTNVNLRKDAFVEPHFGVASGTQMYGPEKKEMYPVSYPIPHLSAAKQVAGEAQYVDDIPNPARGLFAHFVMSSKACATFSGIDAETALKMPGVVAFFSAADIPGVNEIGPVFYGEELFAEKKVEFVGHPVGIIVAESAAQARDAANQVRINWGEERKPILSIEDAIAAKSFLWDTPRFIEKGDVESAFAKSANIVEGEVNVGAQEHFYLEPQGSIANVTDNDEIEIWASTQNPTKTQMKVAAILKLPAGKVITRTKRMGGGFGGKETRSIYVSAACAVAAFKLRRPVRMILDRDVDFATSGARHAFRGNYKIGFDKSGVIEGVDVQLFSNAGYSMDLSFSVMERALFHSLNAYKCPNVRVVGNLCKTNLLSATAFRGFGAPQGMMVVESWMDHIARKLNLAPEVVRMRNFISAGDLTHFNQIVDPTICIGEMYASLMKSCDYENRRKEVARFNAENKYRKRGLSLIPTVFGMSFTAKFMNQAGALVHCYLDGSIQVHHGGTEMGQGLHTKIAQVAAHAFGIELSQVSVIETATDKVSNTSPTAASVSSDINGAAVLDACKQINERLDPLRKEFPEATFAQLCQKAHLQRINLSANGFYRTPDLKEFNFLHRVKEGDVNQPFNYFSQGCACSEVELDTLTGDHTVIRSDIIMDVGNSINPAIDVGQIEGAFVQGQGWCTMEELVWQSNGAMFTRGPGAYKIPGFSDIPKQFNVSLFRNIHGNERAIHSSKGVGEPPFFLGSSILFALKDAIYSARSDSGNSDFFSLACPATCERLRMACEDRFTKQVEKILHPHREFFFL